MPTDCSIEGCDKTSRSRGMCSMHYMRGRRAAGDLPKSEPCTVDGCGAPGGNRGWCPKHYQRWKRTGDPLTPMRSWQKRLEPLPHGHDASLEELRLRHRSRMLKATYGISHHEYEQIAKAQDHRCKLCRQLPTAAVSRGAPMATMVVDHDHTTGAVRGLLCFRCNITLGVVESTGLDRIAEYLRD